VKGFVCPKHARAEETRMSISKKREKRAKNDSPQEKKYSPRYVVAEATMYDFIHSLGIRDVDTAAARMQYVADMTGNADNLDQTDIRRIREIINESENEHYRKIMSAIIAAIEQGPNGVESAHLTATHVVELSFRWTFEYFTVLNLYRDKLRTIKQEMGSVNQLSRLR
jgi:hypothetical protein